MSPNGARAPRRDTRTGDRRLLTAGLLLLLLAGTGCQVTLAAGVEARADGSGWVRAGMGLDDEAVNELGDPAHQLRLDDLRQAGWDVTEPRREADGLTWVRAAKRFATPAEAAQVAAELSGPEGPFRDFRLERSRSFFKTRISFTGLVDLSHGLAGLNDPALQEKLGDADLQLDAAGLQRRFGPNLADSVKVRVEARLPGRVKGEGSTPVRSGVAWQPPIGEQVRIEARSEAWNLQPLVPAVAALLFATTALLVGMRRT